MKTIFLFMSFVITSLIAVCAQSSADAIPKKVLPRLTGEVFVEHTYKGNQYLTDEWCTGAIVLVTGDTIHGLKLKYNGLFDEVIWLNTNNFNKFKVDKPSISEFWLLQKDSGSVHFKKLAVTKPEDKTQYLYLETICEGKLSMYCLRKIKKYGVDQETIEGMHYELEVIVPDPVYYFRLPSGEWVWMRKLKIDELLKYIPNKKKLILQLQEKYHLKFSDKNQCLQFIQHINNEVFDHQ
jgi:hypothetical protein